MPTPMQRAGFSHLLYPGLNKEYLLTYGAYPEEYTKYLNIETSDRYKEEDLVVAGFGLVPEKAEGATPVYDVMKMSEKKAYIHKTYVLGFEVTEEANEDELYGILKKAPRALAIAVKQTIDTLAASVLNNGFSASFPGIDGKALFATDHPQLKAGGTVSNRAAIDVDFDITSLSDALLTWEQWTDDNGFPLLLKPKWIFGSPLNREIMVKTLGTEKMPGTSDNDINAIREWELQKMILHYTTDPDAWGLLSTTAEHYMKLFWRIKPSFRGFDDQATGNARYLTRFRLSTGVTHWWGTYGSPGI